MPVSLDPIPCLRRDLEFIPVDHEGRRLVLIRDYLGLVEEGRAMNPAIFQVMALLRPGKTLKDFKKELTELSGGKELSDEDLERMLEELDQSFLLESDRYRQARIDLEETFAQAEERPCALCGKAYPGDKEKLGKALDQILALKPDPEPEQKKPAQPEESGEQIIVGGVATKPKQPQAPKTPRAIIAPHIDPGVGAAAYAQAYAALNGGPVKRAIVLGVGHQMIKALYSVSTKHFLTPLGKAVNDVMTSKALLSAGEACQGNGANGCLPKTDFAHRQEHSVEFQLLFLQHLLGPRGFAMTPILCGSAHEMAEYSRQCFLDTTGPFLEALREQAQKPGTLVVAGVDFCHIGPKFGHEQSAGEIEEAAAEHDRALLEALAQGDAEGLWKESARVEDRFNVCGFSALATLMEILPGCKADILAHEMWHEEPTQSAVSYAAAALY